MGVQKSRRSLKHTKYSLKNNNDKNIFLTKKKINVFFKKNSYKKNKLFFLKKYENNYSLFF